jgi:hypothetical protein
MVEMSRYIDAERNNHIYNNIRGYFHHKSFVWSFDNTIYILPKAGAIVEHLELNPQFVQKVYFLLNNYPIYWNNYFLHETADAKIVDITFNIGTYLHTILEGMEKSINNTNNFVKLISL